MSALTVNDTRPDAVLTLTSDGTGANLIGAACILHVKRPDKTLFTRIAGSEGLTVTDPDDGILTYRWQTGDLTVSGRYLLEVQVTYSDTGIQTFGPAEVRADPELA